MATERRTLLDVTEADLAYLEQHFTENWTDTLRDLAISHFLTLVSDSRTQPMGLKDLAELAVLLAMGISNDLGGTQPYIPAGASLKHEQNKAKALTLLRDGVRYEVIARECGITPRRVRNIEREQERKKRKECKEAIPGWRDEAQVHTDTTAQQE